MSDWLWSRLKFLGDLRKHRIARWVFLVWAIIAVYDTGGSQLLPTEWVQKRPTVYQVLVVSTGWLSWEVWLLIGAASLALFGIEVGVRHKGRVAANTQTTDRITQVVGRARIAFAHGRAFSDESPRGITHIESFGDETVMLEIDQSVDPATLVVRKEGTMQPLEIVERHAKRVRFKLRPPDESIVTIVIVDGVLTP